jgi:hypothetical protein
MKAPNWAVGMKKIGPGMYVQGDSMHFYAPELCEELGVPPTPENQRIAQEAARQVIQRSLGNVPITEVDDDVPWD